MIVTPRVRERLEALAGDVQRYRPDLMPLVADVPWEFGLRSLSRSCGALIPPPLSRLTERTLLGYIQGVRDAVKRGCAKTGSPTPGTDTNGKDRYLSILGGVDEAQGLSEAHGETTLKDLDRWTKRT